jgi:hypothetical protein
MAFTQANLDALDAQYAKGVRAFTFGDESITLHGVDEYRRLRALMLQSINAAAGRTTTTRLASTSKGV